MFADHLLSWLIVLPLLGIGAVSCVRGEVMVKRIALTGTLLTFGVSLVVWGWFESARVDMQFVERFEVMPTLQVHYAVGVDGISLLLVLLTTLLSPIAVLCSWNAVRTHVRTFMALILLLESAALGVFLSLDLLFFYVFWELTMVCAYFLLVVWGGPGRSAAGLKYVLYSFVSGLLLLLGIVGLYVSGGQTFDLVTLSNHVIDPAVEYWLFLTFFLAFAIKVPMLPFHSWLPDAYAEAPIASVILSGVLTKLGAYGFLRLSLPLFPGASEQLAPFILWLSIAAILYGGYMALAQSDIKRLVAYSSISHMGFVTLGIFVFNSQGLQGAVLQMFNHGITTAALFLAIGQLADRTGSQSIHDYGGLHKTMPRFVALFCLFSVASFGLPGTCNFIGEFLVLVGTSSDSFVKVLLAMMGIILAASYMLWMLQRVALGQSRTPVAARLPDLNWRETATMIPLALAVLWVGLYPAPLLNVMDASVTALIQHTTGGVAVSQFLPGP